MVDGVVVGLPLVDEAVGDGVTAGSFGKALLDQAGRGDELADRPRFEGGRHGQGPFEDGVRAASGILVGVGDGQDTAGLDFLHDDDPPLGVNLILLVLQGLLHEPLDVAVDGQTDFAPVFSRFGDRFSPGDLLPAFPPLVDLLAVLPFEGILRHLLDPGHAHVVVVDPADDGPGGRPAGIGTGDGQFGPYDPGQVEVVDRPFGRRGHVLLQDDVGVDPGQLGPQLHDVHFEDRGQHLGHGAGTGPRHGLAVEGMADSLVVPGAFFRLEVAGAVLVGVDGVPLLTLSHDHPVHIRDGPPQGLDGVIHRTHLDGVLGDGRSFDQLDEGQTDDEDDDGQAENHSPPAKGPAVSRILAICGQGPPEAG